MSYKAGDWAMKLDLDAHDKMVLLALAYYANKHTDECHPSLATLTLRTGMSQRRVQTAISRLRDWGLIELGWRGRSRRYLLKLAMVAPRATDASATVAPGASTVAPGAPEGGMPCQLTRNEHVPEHGRESPPAPKHGVTMLGGNGCERLGRHRVAATAAAGRLAADWQPSADDVAFAQREHAALDWRREARAFRDYWLAKPGEQGVRGDWSAMWRRWLDQAYRFADKRSRGVGKPGAGAAAVDPWETRLKLFADKGDWVGELWGAAPGQPGCRVPAELLRRYGFAQPAASASG